MSSATTSIQECVAAYCRKMVSELSVEASSMQMICTSPIDCDRRESRQRERVFSALYTATKTLTFGMLLALYLSFYQILNINALVHLAVGEDRRGDCYCAHETVGHVYLLYEAGSEACYDGQSHQ